MKKLVALFTLSACMLCAQDVVVVSATSVTVDGVESGKPIDCIRNRPELAAKIQSALEVWSAAKDAQVKAAQAELESSKKARGDLIALAKEKVQQLSPEAQLVVSNLIAAAEAPEIQRRRDALAKELAAKQRELDALK